MVHDKKIGEESEKIVNTDVTQRMMYSYFELKRLYIPSQHTCTHAWSDAADDIATLTIIRLHQGYACTVMTITTPKSAAHPCKT